MCHARESLHLENKNILRTFLGPKRFWNFMVSIRRKERDSPSVHFCGGALLNQRWVRFLNINNTLKGPRGENMFYVKTLQLLLLMDEKR